MLGFNVALISLKQEQETSYTILRARSTNVTISGLKPDTTYVFQIRARTAAGYGTNSRKFEFETSPDCKCLPKKLILNVFHAVF